MVSASKTVFRASCSDHADTLTKEFFCDTLVPLCVTSVSEIKRGRELPDYLDTSSFSFPSPVQIFQNSGNVSAVRRIARPSAQQSLEGWMLCLALRGGCSSEHRRSKVQRSRRGAEEDISCHLLFVAAVVPSTRTEGRVVWDVLSPNCLQEAKRREKLSCIMG